MAYGSSENSLIGQRIEDVSTVQAHRLGARFKCSDDTYGPGEFIYLKGVASTVVGSVVTFNLDDGTTTLAVANAVGPVAVAMSACDAATKFGWYQIYGKGVARVLSGFVDDADCYLTSTAGSIDDADVAGDYIRGMKGASAVGTPSANLAEVELSYPEVADGKDN
jgi:hypothetical protein